MQTIRTLLNRAKSASAVISLLGGAVGLVSGISAFISAGEAKQDQCDTKRDALILMVSANSNQERYLDLRASLLADSLVNLAEKDPEFRKSGELNDLLAGLLKIKNLQELNARKYTSEKLDAIKCSRSSVQGFSLLLRGEQIVKENLTNPGWEEIFKRADATLASRTAIKK
jgi:hypothetical protein